MVTIETMDYAQLASLKADIEGLMQDRRNSALEELRAKAVSMGFDMLDFSDAMNGKKQNQKHYANPDNPEEIYKGKGKRPEWLKAKLDAGADQEDFRI